ncbi:2254_t:CDS:2 [Entrophospora sp. SA101]|nr:2254_t:CDS:2 [Entrophospora sp. SA101]
MYKKTKQHIFKNYTSRRITPKVIKLNNDTDNTEYDGDYEYEYLKTTTTYFTKQNQGQEKIYNDIIDKEFKKKVIKATQDLEILNKEIFYNKNSIPHL